MKKLKHSDIYNYFYHFCYFRFLANHSFSSSNRHEVFGVLYEIINTQYDIAVSKVDSLRRDMIKALRAASYDFYKENIKCRN